MIFSGSSASDPTVCECGLSLEPLNCTFESATDVCGKQGLMNDNDVSSDLNDSSSRWQGEAFRTERFITYM